MFSFNQIGKPLRRFLTTSSICPRKMALTITPFERNIIDESLTKTEAKESFKKLDREGGGEIDVTELSKVFETDMKGTEQFLEKMIDHVELSSTGTLNFAEFLVLMVKSQGVNGVQRAFLSYDVDGSGSITREELKDWMTRHGRFLTRRQVQMMVDAVDVNGDGEIDYAEFLMLVTRRILRMKAIEATQARV